MDSRTLLFWCVALVALWSVSGQQCNSKSLTMSGSSRQNATGHWIVQASIAHRGGDGAGDLTPEMRPWNFDINFKRTDCAEQDVLQLTLTATAPPRKPPADYTLYHGLGYYKLHTEPATWQVASDTCQKEGAHLAILNSKEEEEAARAVISKHSKGNFSVFLGFHDQLKEGEFITVFGEPLSSVGYSHWQPTEPNEKSSSYEDCGSMHSTGGLNDLPCEFKEKFICEHELW